MEDCDTSPWPCHGWDMSLSWCVRAGRYYRENRFCTCIEESMKETVNTFLIKRYVLQCRVEEDLEEIGRDPIACGMWHRRERLSSSLWDLLLHFHIAKLFHSIIIYAYSLHHYSLFFFKLCSEVTFTVIWHFCY